MSNQTFKCRLCRRRVPWSFGCDDTFPHLCDDCWVRVQPTDTEQPAALSKLLGER